MENMFTENSLNIILSPHLDDAVISLGGFIYKHPDNTKVITIFSGKPKTNKVRIWDLWCGFKNSSQALKSRLTENDTALTSLGLIKANIINLDFLDYQYTNKKERERNGNIMNEILSDKLLDTLNKGKCKNINLFAPIAIKHKDHEFVHNFLNYFKKNNLNSNFNIQFFFYEDYPYFFKFKKSKGYFQYLSHEKENFLLTKKDLEIKINAIGIYKSQFKFPFTVLASFFRQIKKDKKNIFDKETVYKLI
ncbi:MAG: PIG-L family deacetylase [Candidatus Nomurabacteria bacterium]